MIQTGKIPHIHRLFVYGSLCPGRPNAHVLEQIGGKWEKAKVRGKLYEAGWGAEIGFPGLVLMEDGDYIDGYIFHSEGLDQHWDRIDAFEGAEYVRVLTMGLGEETGAVDVYVYALSNKNLPTLREKRE